MAHKATCTCTYVQCTWSWSVNRSIARAGLEPRAMETRNSIRNDHCRVLQLHLINVNSTISAATHARVLRHTYPYIRQHWQRAGADRRRYCSPTIPCSKTQSLYASCFTSYVRMRVVGNWYFHASIANRGMYIRLRCAYYQCTIISIV